VRFEGNWNQPTRLTTLVNCRNRLNPPIPKNYFGNATFPTVTVVDEANGDGFLVTVCLQTLHIDALKKLFYEDMEIITSSKL
jgi:hypothetical protein